MNKETLIKNLNDDLADELAAVIQYTTYAAKTNGPQRPQLSAFFTSEVADELGHAKFLANKIVALGGEPTTKPSPVKTAETNYEMLEAVLEAERKAIRGYSARAEEAEKFGDKGLMVTLEDMVADETTHAEETERIMREWSATG